MVTMADRRRRLVTALALDTRPSRSARVCLRRVSASQWTVCAPRRTKWLLASEGCPARGHQTWPGSFRSPVPTFLVPLAFELQVISSWQLLGTAWGPHPAASSAPR